MSVEITSIVRNVTRDPKHDMALSVLEGLTKHPKSLPSSLFYDDRGSELFKQIMALEEYYPTDCEIEILKKKGATIASHLQGEDFNIVELGCGDGSKTILLLNEFLKSSQSFSFVPLDISEAAVKFLIENLKKEYGEVPFEVQGLVAEYFEGLSWLNENVQARNFVMFLGSNIGNFNRSMALKFLRQLWYSLNNDDFVLIGFDLKKDLDVLYDAYNDSKGVTKEFNLNVLDRINEVLGGDFKRSEFQHQGLYNVQTGAMESYLISQSQQTVTLEELGKSFRFKPWEPIHMEFSYKYLMDDIEGLAHDTGFEIVKNYTDSRNYFVDSLWKVKKR